MYWILPSRQNKGADFMPENSPRIITSKQAKKQINHFGRSLVIYIAVFMVFRYGTSLLATYFPQIFIVEPQIVYLVGEMGLLVLVTLIPFRISARMLNLDIHDYLRNPRIPASRMVAIISIGIGINLIATSISSLFYFFARTNSATYDFLGKFTTETYIIENALYILENVFIIPICDEYIFRGIIQRQLGHYGRYFGVLGSAMLFAVSQANLVMAIPAFFVGWYLSLITLKYHSIRPAVQVHIVLSLFLVLMDIAPESMLLVITLAIVAVYIIAAFSIFRKRVSTNMVRYGATEPKLWKILLTSPSIIVCIILFAVNVVLSLI
jgi:hypothetical protein